MRSFESGAQSVLPNHPLVVMSRPQQFAQHAVGPTAWALSTVNAHIALALYLQLHMMGAGLLRPPDAGLHLG